MKESINAIDHPRIVFRETFNSEQDVRRNGGTPTDVTFSKGVGEFNGTSSGISYPLPFGTEKWDQDFSVRIKFKADNTASGNLWSFGDGTNRYAISFETNIIAIGKRAGGGFFDRSIAFTDTDSWHELVAIFKAGSVMPDLYLDNVAGTGTVSPTATPTSHFSIGYISASPGNEYDGNIEFVEIYNYALTSDEVYNLYHNRRFRELTGQDEILSVSAQSGTIIDRWGNTLTLTNTEVKKQGEVRAIEFNGSDSEVDCGSPDDLTGDKTIVVWLKPYKLSGIQRVIDNSKLIVFLNGSQIIARNDGSSNAIMAQTFSINQWQQLAFTRASGGSIDFYHNGVFSDTDTGGGTPEAGTTNIKLSNSVAYYKGLMSDVRIVDGLLTVEEISQLFSNERKRYNI